ncbi:hypothetical protein MtrunA17_Chr8g0366661 [Medicago truncatula]|uniref:Uncharacterized protein n=1 Tax=Medicago truncatula TaxID=3880 RepID=A0A072TT89_MEDTR|nr:hypothetical protein MTR_8g066952 [Medicago truncatula]RHN41492.1 hypothetical protein MtrunA17_Chr8g0366661 [Medicago truncatula]
MPSLFPICAPSRHYPPRIGPRSGPTIGSASTMPPSSPLPDPTPGSPPPPGSPPDPSWESFLVAEHMLKPNSTKRAMLRTFEVAI